MTKTYFDLMSYVEYACLTFSYAFVSEWNVVDLAKKSTNHKYMQNIWDENGEWERERVKKEKINWNMLLHVERHTKLTWENWLNMDWDSWFQWSWSCAVSSNFMAK